MLKIKYLLSTMFCSSVFMVPTFGFGVMEIQQI